MDRKGALIPAFAAAAAAVLYLGALSSKERALSQGYEQADVLVARVDIPERTVLKEEFFDTMRVPRRFVQQDAFEVRTPSDLRLVSNLVTRVRVPKGNQLTQSSLTAMAPDAGLSVKIPPGYRGAVLPIEATMKPLIKPGDRVDVLLTFDAVMEGNRREKVTATILQNVLVVAVGSDMGQGQTASQLKKRGADDERASAFTDKAVISLALNPNELQYLALMQQQGQTTIGVRGLGDSEMHVMPMASLEQLFDPRRRP